MQNFSVKSTVKVIDDIEAGVHIISLNFALTSSTSMFVQVLSCSLKVINTLLTIKHIINIWNHFRRMCMRYAPLSVYFDL